MPSTKTDIEQARTVRNLTGGEVMAEFLLDWDVRYVFGLAGSEEAGFLDALVDRPELRYTTCLHESAAMAMADGYARSTGRTSFVQLHSVAGVAYALGQMAGSFRDRVPVVVTAGRQATRFRGHDGFLESPNLTELPRDYTQWVWDVMNAETIPEVLRRAFILAEAPPGGPVFVTFSKDLWEQRIGEAELIPRSRSRVDSNGGPPPRHVQAIADALLTAEQPVIFLGNECIHHEISESIAAIAELTGAMVMLSVKIPTVFPSTHPQFVGEVLEDPDLLRDVDCLWSVGAHLFKTFERPAEPVVPRNATVIHTSLVASEVGRNYPVDHAAYADIRTTSDLVLQELRARERNTAAIGRRLARVHAYTAAQRTAFREAARTEWDDQPIATSRLMLELDKVMAPDAEIVSELITSDHYPRRYLTFDHTRPPSRRRRQHYTTSGVLGWAVGAAIGTKLGNPAKEVWCLTGDGCFNFGSQALWSAARYRVPVGVVVFNNREYQANRHNQNLYRGRGHETGRYVGADLGNPDIDYVQLAGAYGVAAECVTEPGQLAEALRRCQRAMGEGRPFLLDVHIKRYEHGADRGHDGAFSIADDLRDAG